MEKHGLIISLAVVSLLFVGSLGFGIWAFMGMQDYRDNADIKIAEAVEVAEENLTIKKDAEFAEEYKKPFSIYKGPSSYGTLTLTYPKTWSNYVSEGRGSSPLDGYMHRSFVSADQENTHYALRYQVVNSSYDQELRNIESYIRGGRAKAHAYRSPKQPTARAIRVEGEIDSRKTGTMVMVELRGFTIKIWTEGDEFKQDFEKIIEEMTFIQ